MLKTYINGTTFSHEEIALFRNAEVATVIEVIKTINENAARNAKLGFLSRYIEEIEGIQGHMENHIQTTAAFGDDGDLFIEGDVMGEKMEQWTFQRRGYVLKAFDFATSLIEEAYETSTSLLPIVQRRMKKISELYMAKYLPAIAYEALFEIVEGGTYFQQPKGFLKNVIVDGDMLKFYVDATVARNHYRSVSGSTGIQMSDINFFLDYMGQYSDINESDIILVGARLTLNSLQHALAAPATVDSFNQTLVPTYTILGMRYVVDTQVPKDILFFWNEQADSIIKKLVSPKMDMRGLAVFRQEKFGKDMFTFDVDMTIFSGAKIKIMPEGYNVTGRHQVLLVDTAPTYDWAAISTEITTQKALSNPLYTALPADDVNGADTAARAAARVAYQDLRLMQANGITKLVNHKNALRNSWYKIKG